MSVFLIPGLVEPGLFTSQQPCEGYRFQRSEDSSQIVGYPGIYRGFAKLTLANSW
jgi:hypothetical protein